MAGNLDAQLGVTRGERGNPVSVQAMNLEVLNRGGTGVEAETAVLRTGELKQCLVLCKSQSETVCGRTTESETTINGKNCANAFKDIGLQRRFLYNS